MGALFSIGEVLIDLIPLQKGRELGVCVAMEPNHAISISGHKKAIFFKVMSANITYGT